MKPENIRYYCRKFDKSMDDMLFISFDIEKYKKWKIRRKKRLQQEYELDIELAKMSRMHQGCLI